MKTRYWINAGLLAALVLLLVSPCLAGSNWEAGIKVSQGELDTRLAFGQNSNATAAADDGRFDVPAMLSESLQAYFATDGKQLWRDIRGTGATPLTWELKVSSDHPGSRVRIAWDRREFPPGVQLTLTDEYLNAVIDMQTTPWYSFAGAGTRTFRLTVAGP